MTTVHEEKISWGDGLKVLSDSTPSYVTEPQTAKLTLTDKWGEDVADSDEGDEVPAYVVLNNTTALSLTKRAVVSLAKAVSVPKDLLFSSPPHLTVPLVNYWLSTVPDAKGPCFTVSSSDVATAMVAGSSVFPLNAAQVATSIAFEVRSQLGDDSMILRFGSRFDLRPNRTEFTIVSDKIFFFHPQTGEKWYWGVHTVMSLTGHTAPTISAYLCRADGVGIIPSRGVSKYSVRKHGKSLDSVFDWVSDSVGVLTADAEDLVARYATLYDQVVADAEMSNVLTDLLEKISLPVSSQNAVIENAEALEDDVLTAFTFVRLVAELQDVEDETPERIERIQRAAGEVPDIMGARCTKCHNLLSHSH